jgi:hypothetical protein
LRTVLGRPCRVDVKNYQGPTTSRENAIRKYVNFRIRFFKFCFDYDLNLCRYLNPELPPMGGFRISNTREILHFCMWNFVWADKANGALSAQTKFHIQKCNTSRVLEILSPRIKFHNGTVCILKYRYRTGTVS